MRLLLTKVVSLISIAFSICAAWGQYTLQTAAGGGPRNIPAVGASSNFPQHLTYANGALYVADAGEDRIFKVDQTGLVTVVAGSGWAVGNPGVPTGDGGLAINANVAKPSAVAVDATGNVYFVDSFGLRKVDTSGVISTLPPACLNYGGNDFEFPLPIAIDPTGQLLYCLTSYGYPAGTSVVSQVNLSTFAVTPFAGGGSSSADGVPPTSEELDIVNGLAVGSSGDLYIAGTSNNHVAWKVSGGSITHIAGGGVLPPNSILATSANLGGMQDIALDSANDVFLADGIHIYRIDASSQFITLYAGAPPIDCPTYRA